VGETFEADRPVCRDGAPAESKYGDSGIDLKDKPSQAD
jgi:hypothetical protein